MPVNTALFNPQTPCLRGLSKETVENAMAYYTETKKGLPKA